MAKQLNIYIKNLDSSYLEWCLKDMQQTLLCGFGMLEEVAAQLAAHKVERILLWIAGEEVFSTTIQYPGRGSMYLLRAAPNIVEELLAQELESVHWVISKHLGKGKYCIFTVDDARFAGLLAKLSEHNLNPDATYVDFVGLPIQDSTDIFIVQSDARCLLLNNQSCIEKTPGMAIPVNIIEASLKYILSDKKAPVNVKLLTILTSKHEARSDLSGSKISSKITLFDAEVVHTEEERDCMLVEIFQEPKDKSFNLQQRKYVTQNKQQSYKNIIGLRMSGALISICFMLWIGSNEIKTLHLQEATIEARQMSERLYLRAFPEEDKLEEDLLNQARAKLSGVSTQENNQFMMLLYAFIDKMAAYSSNEFRILNMNYNDQQSVLTVELQINSFPLLDDLKVGLINTGLKTEISYANQVGDKVQARLRIGISE